ncbi:MAG: MFS transporter [Spirochaetes bacterium RBG_13_51_14]|nr:MAG: MFS transporter [Spirochaetes bacterium RBG_13_51_14]
MPVSNTRSPRGPMLAMRALRHRNFRLFFFGQGVSLIGTWMQSVATSWLVFRMTHSEFMLGLVAFAGQIPAFLISPFAGVLGDRLSRHRIIIAVQVLAMAQAFILAGITLAGAIQVWHIIILSLFLGIINAFEMPARQAFVIEMLEDKSDLGNAIALNSGLFNGSRMIGPSIAGIIMAFAGEGLCFLINGISYGAALAALLLMNIPRRNTEERRTRLLSELKDGLAYAFGFRPIRDLLITVAFMSLVAMSFPVLLPVFAGSVLHGGAHIYGFLVASSGAGALAGVAFLAMRKSVLGLGRVITIALVLFGSGLVAFSFSHSAALSISILAPVGFGMIAVMASCNTMVQTIVDEDKRGRVMSFYVMVFMGGAPLGSLLAGSVSSAIGAPYTVCIGGMVCVLGAIVFALRLPSLRTLIRPIYRKMGIIPEVAIGIQTAEELRKPPEYSGN